MCVIFIFRPCPLILVCTYEKMGGVAKDKGGMVKQLHTNSSDVCNAKCDATEGCGSTVFCSFGGAIGTDCYLHAKKLIGSEELKPEKDGRCFSYFKKCTLGRYSENYPVYMM